MTRKNSLLLASLKKQLSGLNKQTQDYGLQIVALKKLIKESEDEIGKIETKRYQLWGSKHSLREQIFKLENQGLKFPPLKRPKEVASYMRAGWNPVPRPQKNFCSFLYYDRDNGGWIYRVFGVMIVPNKQKHSEVSVGFNGKKHYSWPGKVESIYELYREYEDGRRFKSWRVYSSGMQGQNFSVGKRYDDRTPDASRTKWVSTCGYLKIFDHGEDPAVPKKLIAHLERKNDPMLMLRMYKKYPLSRHLFAKGEIGLAFRYDILTNLRGERLNKFKNWWANSEASTWFYWKPTDYSDVKKYILDENLSQRELFIRLENLIPQLDSRTANYFYRQHCSTYSLYKDYLTMLTNFGFDADNPVLRFPKNLRAAHDALVARKSDVTLQKKRIERNRVTLATFKIETYEDLGVRIVPFKDADDFYFYGTFLGHCYKINDNYFDSMFAGKSMMFAVSDIVTNDPLSVVEYSFSSKQIINNLMRGNKEANELCQCAASRYVLDIAHERIA